jgi:hypothetical protein
MGFGYGQKYIGRPGPFKWRPKENCSFSQFLCQAQILILEIFLYIPVVKIFAYLELEKISTFP